MVVQAGLQVGHDLREGDGNFVEACDVVVVVVGVVEGGVRGELGQVELQALVLVDGHLPLLEGSGLLVVDEGAEHEFGGELLLVREAGGVDGGEALDEGAAAGERVVVGAGRVVGELVVVALVAEVGGVLGGVAELVLPYLIEETGELARAGGDVLREVLRGDGGGCGRGSGAELCVQREMRDCCRDREQ